MPLRCACGEVRGVATDVVPERGNRLVCLCDDCRAYGRWLGRDDVLDEHGGTDIFQLTPAQVRIEQGRAYIRCVRLTARGLMRWHTACCKTPIANTVANPKIPFLGMPHRFMDHEADGRTRDEALGPVLAGVHGRFCQHEMPDWAHARAPAGLIFRSLGQFVRGWWNNAHTPSPLFDAETGAPIVEPIVLSDEQRAPLYAPV